MSVPVQTRGGSPVIPQTAVRPSERGFLAFVVGGDEARGRELGPGMRTADGRGEVLDGAKVGELLVTRGAEALRDGAAVRVAEGPKPTLKGEPGPQPEGANGGGGARR